MKEVVDQSTLERVTSPSVSVYDEDLKMRAAMYGVLFQAYADKVTPVNSSHIPSIAITSVFFGHVNCGYDILYNNVTSVCIFIGC